VVFSDGVVVKSVVLVGVVKRFRGSGRALAATARNRNLLRVQLSFGAAWTAEWLFVVVIGVVAFRNGGASAVGVITFLRMAPPAVLAPFASTLADRFRREFVLIWSSLLRAAATAAAALLLVTGGPIVGVYAFSVLAACAFILFRATNSALLPALCVTPLELTTATMSRGLVDSVSTLLGPLIAAVLLRFADPAAGVGVVAALSLSSGALLVRLSYEASPRDTPPFRRIATDMADGFRALMRYRDAALLIWLALAQTFARGCLTVFLVVIAFDLLKTGQAGVGVLTAAVGAGATVGSLGALTLVTGRRLAVIEGIGVALWGLPITLSGALPYTPVVLGLMCVVGIGNALVDVGLFTLLPRLVPDSLLGRTFGSLEGLIALSVAAGSLITPLVITLLGLRGALLALGLVAPAAAALAWRRLRLIDGSIVHIDEEIAVLRQLVLFQRLPLPMIENLAARVGLRTVPAGVEVFHQGDAGDFFYVIEDGKADVMGDGRVIRSLGPGECFGEIALLNDTPRTATVRARTLLRLHALSGPDFLLAVSSYSASAIEAQSLLHERLATFTPSPETDMAP
jgi:Cyclic nucleotide-binding domain